MELASARSSRFECCKLNGNSGLGAALARSVFWLLEDPDVTDKFSDTMCGKRISVIRSPEHGGAGFPSGFLLLSDCAIFPERQRPKEKSGARRGGNSRSPPKNLQEVAPKLIYESRYGEITANLP